MLSPELLRTATLCTTERASAFAQHLTDACRYYGIDDPDILPAFLAQAAHESRAFEALSESLNYRVDALLSTFGLHRISEEEARRYGRTETQKADQRSIANLVYGGEWGRKNLGNTQIEDGWNFRARGFGITGRSNYRAAAQALRFLGAPDFEADPDALSEPKWAAWSFAQWWQARGLNKLAKAGKFDEITQIINGGQNGAADRRTRLEMAKAALATYMPTPAEKPAVGPSAVSQTPSTSIPAGEAPDWTPQPVKDQPMAPIAISLLTGLAQSLYTAFVPLAHEKLTKELARHTSHPEVAEQVATATIHAVQRLTGKEDPIEAVMVAKADPAIIAQAQETALAELEKFMPILERAAVIDRDVFADEEASKDAAAKRASGYANDQDRYLTVSIIWLMVGLMFSLAVLMGVLAWLKVGDTVLMGVFGLFNAAGMIAVSKFGTRYDHRYGSSAGSAAKDAVVEQLSRRKP
jgi:putative chitinase